MSDSRSPFYPAAIWMLLCSICQLTLPLILGFQSSVYTMMLFGMVGLVTALGLFKGWRWLAYLSFIPIMAVAILAMARSFDVTGLASFWYGAIAVSDLIAAVFIFIALWRNPQNV